MPGIQDYDEWGGFYLTPDGTITPMNPRLYEETINNNAYRLLLHEVRNIGYDHPLQLYTIEQQVRIVNCRSKPGHYLEEGGRSVK